MIDVIDREALAVAIKNQRRDLTLAIMVPSAATDEAKQRMLVLAAACETLDRLNAETPT